MDEHQVTGCPDYAKYSLRALYDVRERIDAQNYPDRAAALEREIQIRLEQFRSQNPEGVKTAVDQSHPLSRVGVGAFLVVSGILSLVHVFNQRVAVRALPMFVLYLLPMVLYGAMIASGILLLKRRRLGLWLGLWVMALQLPLLQVGHFTYVATSFPTLELKLWPLLGFAQTWGARLTVWWNAATQPLYLGLNLTACVGFGPLAYHLERHELASKRLQRRRGVLANNRLEPTAGGGLTAD